MEAGKLRWQITIQQRIQTPNAYGEKVADMANPADWTNVVSCWAAFEPEGKEREFHGKGEFLAEQTTVIRIRYLPGIKPEMRVLFVQGPLTRYLSIRKVMNKEERGIELQLHCVEYVQGG
jgi:SPP1 family predicted phage head-tail adaptor